LTGLKTRKAKRKASVNGAAKHLLLIINISIPLRDRIPTRLRGLQVETVVI
jgi:hypothetical protein